MTQMILNSLKKTEIQWCLQKVMEELIEKDTLMYQQIKSI